MKRHPLLIPLSQEHHHSLALCLRLLRNPSDDHQAEIARHTPELLAHFTSEEAQFAPYWAKLNQPSLQARFEADHATLRQLLAAPKPQSADWICEFAETLKAHARFEERELFPALTPLLPDSEA